MRVPLSISIDELQAKLNQSIEAAIRELPDIKPEESKPAFFPDIGTIGFILRDWEDRGLEPRAAHKLSTSVTESFGRGSVITVLRDRDIICGFFPLEQRF